MIRKLRIKLIAVSMLSLLLVLLLIMGTVNLLNYRDIVAGADTTLALLEENGGRFPQRLEGRPAQDMPKPGPMSPELPYESRYFSVTLNGAGETVTVDTGKIAAVDTTTAIEFARRVFESGKTGGFLGNYRYTRSDGEEGALIIFLDCGRSLSTFRSFLLASCGISALGLLAVLGLVVLFSGRIIKPVSESYEKQKRFITDAGHELKTPLTIIDADTEVLAMETGENEWIRDIRRQTARLASLTNDLTYLSRLEEQHPLQKMEFPLSDVVDETAQSFQAPARTQGKHLRLRIQPMLSLYGDERAVRQLVSILLDNALKYSDEGADISLTLDRQGKTVRLTVENTTRAPLPDNLDSLFDRFYRADSSRNSQTGGHGLGLSIARAVVEAHKGKISASAGAGGTLRITAALPAGV